MFFKENICTPTIYLYNIIMLYNEQIVLVGKRNFSIYFIISLTMKLLFYIILMKRQTLNNNQLYIIFLYIDTILYYECI